MTGNGNNINGAKSGSLQKPQQQQKQAVAQVAVSFFQRIISGGNTTSQKGNASHVNTESDSVVVSNNSENTVQSVQTLKQFWINAFGSGSGGGAAQKKTANSERIRKERVNSVNCEEIEVDRGKSTEKSLSLNRNFVVSDSAYSKKRLSDNFYKYKTADLVKTSRNSDLFQCSEPNLVPLVASYLPTSETMIITSENRPETISTISVIMNDDKKYQQSDNTAEKESVSSSRSLTLSKSSSGSSLACNATESSVSSSRKTGSNPSARKCSFRTNSYHVKKSANSNAAGNKVAALTHRFNQLIQNDADIREEVSRKRKVILHRSGGHVFRVMAETVDSPSKSKKNSSRRMEIMSVDRSPAKLVKKKSSIRRKNSAKVSVIQQSPEVPVSVKEKIQIFEPSDAITTKAIVQKPAVPSKSANVLRRTQEIVAQNNLKKLQNSTGDMDVVTLTANIAPKVVPNIVSNEPPKKSSVSRIYEKLAIRSTTFLSRKKIYTSVASKPIQEVPDVEEEQYESVEKIMDALAVVSQRIEHLSKSESCLLSVDSDRNSQSCSDITPNPSFLFRSTSKPADVIEAINTSIFKKTKSMDEAHFPSPLRIIPKAETREYGTIFRETDELLQRIKESIQKDDTPKIAESADEEIQASSDDCSSIYQSIFGAESQISNKPYESSTDSSNIYQSISEALSNGSAIITETSKIVDPDTVSINSYESFENYEAVDDELLENIRNENGYEICTPEKDTPPEPPPPRISGSQTLSTNSPEPALPLPKRAFTHFELQKSNSASSNYEIIKYDKVPPRPPKSITHVVQSTAPSLPAPPMLPLERNSSTETEYDGENIYDTIKSIRSEAVIESVGDYESIEVPSPFLRVKRSFKRSPNESDTGSTLSSDVKTNSLYGTTMNRIDKVVSQNDVADSNSDNSDDWIDMSDGEADNGQKHKFVV